MAETIETCWAMTWCGVELTSDAEVTEHVGCEECAHAMTICT